MKPSLTTQKVILVAILIFFGIIFYADLMNVRSDGLMTKAVTAINGKIVNSEVEYRRNNSTYPYFVETFGSQLNFNTRLEDIFFIDKFIGVFLFIFSFITLFFYKENNNPKKLIVFEIIILFFLFLGLILRWNAANRSCTFCHSLIPNIILFIAVYAFSIICVKKIIDKTGKESFFYKNLDVFCVYIMFLLGYLAKLWCELHCSSEWYRVCILPLVFTIIITLPLIIIVIYRTLKNKKNRNKKRFLLILSFVLFLLFVSFVFYRYIATPLAKLSGSGLFCKTLSSTSSTYDSDDCLKTLGIQKKDVLFCDDIKLEYMQNECCWEVALEKNDILTCDKCKTRDQCIIFFAGHKKNVDLCSQIGEKKKESECRDYVK